MTDFKQFFENDFCGTQAFLDKVLKPVFGEYEKGYDILTNDSDTKKLARESGIEKIQHAATFDFLDTDLKIYDITVEDSKNLAINKVRIQSIVRKYVDQFEGALIIFHHNQVKDREWRLSYVEKRSSATDSTSAKRYSYILGKNHPARTVCQRFADLEKKGHENLIIADLTQAFSVESLTKEFYQELFAWYTWACELSTFPKGKGSVVKQTKDNNEINLIRLITRLMFVWFIKQKDLIPSWIFDTNELEKILAEFDSQSLKSGNYYNAVIQNLFFATLNKTISERSFTNENAKEQYGIKTFYRDDTKKSFFKVSHEEMIEKFKSVPFLNGGLFECLDRLEGDEKDKNVQIYSDGFSREKDRRAFLPNALFFMKESEGHEGLISILNRYNFTVEENTPSDVQVALDPELLGKVFENLLGTYNPETSETARKDSGSFYTPRTIVNFMVNESVKNYLKNATEITDKNLEKLFDENTESLDFEGKEKVVEALKKIKILDPACGSGAFPMGILQCLVSLIKKLDPKYDTKEALYKLKLDLIENSIFGSDIQTIAVQICKLRFFITLICEQDKTDNEKDNYGFNPLPNLETKFVCANSLIGISKNEENMAGQLFDNGVTEARDELKDIRSKHFKAQTSKEKMHYRALDKECREKLVKLLEQDQMYDNKDAKQLASWSPYDQNATADFFDEDWMFGITDGFDIVIGNPPYISTKGVSAEDKKLYEQEFGFSDDTYNLFTFKGLELTKEKGSLSYIIPKTFWTTQTKRNMRDLILGRNIKYIFDTANPFDAVMVDTCIIQIENTKYNKQNKIRFLDGCENLLQPKEFEPILQNVYLNTQNCVIFKPTEQNLKIWKLYGEKVKELYNTWWEKIETSKKISQNEAELKRYRESLKPGDVALLGCLTEGGQGLATANNGKYIAVRQSSKWASNIIASRPKKLAEAIKKYPEIAKELKIKDCTEYLNSLSEKQIAQKFDELKEKYGRDIFGQGYIYKLIDDDEIADVETLTEDEKENGISTKKKYYVPYDKGDKDGNRWYLETPFAIAWSKENVGFLKTDPKARYQGYTFFFREGFCWNNVLNPNARLLKAKMKSASVNDVGSMSLSSICNAIPNYYIVCILNSELLFEYYREFINCTVNIQINDIRQLPVIVPSKNNLEEILPYFQKAVELKKKVAKNKASEQDIQPALKATENKINEFIENLYAI